MVTVLANIWFWDIYHAKIMVLVYQITMELASISISACTFL